jgi:hypothetical protein
MVDRGASNYEVEEFYAAQTGFIAQAFNLDQAKINPLCQLTYERACQVSALLAAGDRAAAYEYIDRLAATESLKLATLVTGGTK